MKSEHTLRIITANDLLSGEVVYLSKPGQWSPNHSEAVLFKDMHAANARLADVQTQDSSVVGPYLAAAAQEGRNAPTPVHFREAFRTRGPSNQFLGKQARTV